jgi:hypothetical protein
MGRGIDVYQVIRSFAQRNGLSELDYKTFAQSVQRQAKLSDQSEPVFRDLALNPDVVLVPKLFLLAKDKKLVLQTVGNEIRSIILPERYKEAFFQEYARMDENPDVPFPDEDSLQLVVPGEWIRSVAIDSDLASIIEASDESSVPLFRLSFSEGVKPIVIPASLSGKLLEYSVQKLRQYLRKGANKEYMFNKLIYAFPGKEGQLKDTLGALLARPSDSVKLIMRSDSDFTYPFWAYFLSAIKKDIDKKKDKSAEDWSYLQAAMICEFFINHYKGKAQRQAELEAALKSLDIALRKSPYYFSLDEILSFKDAKGSPLLGKFSQDYLAAWLHERSTKVGNGALPEFLVLSSGAHRIYVATDRALSLTVKLISEARAELRLHILDQWKHLLEDFKHCPAMMDDTAFLAELNAQIQARFPILDALLGSRLLPLVRDEAAARDELPLDVAHLFYKDDLVALDEMLSLDRKGLLTDAKMLLPFWYSVPIFLGIARFIHQMGKSREGKAAAAARAARAALAQASAQASAQAEEAATEKTGKRGLTAKERRAEFEAAANRVAKELLPRDYSLDEYLRELEGRWNTLLNPEAKRNLSYDVDCLARDYLRSVVRTMGASTLTTERVKNLGSSLADAPALLKIKNHQALELYLQLYMLKILGAHIEVS